MTNTTIVILSLLGMKRFPTVHDLAEASEDDVNAHWAGLGFYRRARLLHKGAKHVVEHFNGELPQTVDELMEIDGIGRYTASAIASIAFDVCVPVVDGNVCRVLSRLRGIANHIKAPILKDNLGWKLAEQIVRAGDGTHAGEVNQALMELGATYCAPSGTGTDKRDPLRNYYMSPEIGSTFVEERKRLMQLGFDSFPVEEYTTEANSTHEHGQVCKLCDGEGVHTILQKLSDTAESLNGNTGGTHEIGHGVFPMAPPKKAKREETLVVAAMSFISTEDNYVERWLLVKRPAAGLLAGQWEFPSACVWTSASTSTQKTGKKRKNVENDIPLIVAPKRAKALNRLLREFSAASGRHSCSWLEECHRVCVGDDPVEHVFSHVRHTMWIEYGDCTKHVDEGHWASVEWKSTEGRQLKWMSEDDMHRVGVTAGVKKILNVVKAKRRPQTKAKR